MEKRVIRRGSGEGGGRQGEGDGERVIRRGGGRQGACHTMKPKSYVIARSCLFTICHPYIDVHFVKCFLCDLYILN